EHELVNVSVPGQKIVDGAQVDLGPIIPRRVVVIGRQHAVVEQRAVGVVQDAYLRRGDAGPHTRGVIGANVHTYEACSGGAEVVLGLVIDVGLEAPLRVVGEAGLWKGVTVVTARRVRSLRHRDARIVGRPVEHV